MFGSFTTAAHFDTIVAPSPLTGTGGALQTWGGAFLLAQTVDEYQTMQRWGKSEWDRGNANQQDDGEGIEDQINNEAEDEAEQQCEDFANNPPSCGAGGCADGQTCNGFVLDTDPDTPGNQSQNGTCSLNGC